MRYLTAAVSLLAVLALLVACRKGPKEKEILPPPKIVKRIPVDANPLRKTYEAEELGPEVTRGDLTSDPLASNQMALFVKPGDAKPGEYVAWGPYEEISPGSYIARWRLRAADLPQDGKAVIWLDISGTPKADRDDYKTLMGKTLYAKDFPDPEEYNVFKIFFDVNEPFIFELRTQYLQDSEIWVDWTSLELAQ
ncbi:MAG: hypothetical protein GTN49_03845 [candidate division Zixibacteria bacterium]|nr:hypothetical protein [candidate division Zixibacteria bacterium]